MQCKWGGRIVTNPAAKFCPSCGRPLASVEPQKENENTEVTDPSQEKNTQQDTFQPAPQTKAAFNQDMSSRWDTYRNPNQWLKWVALGVGVLAVAVGVFVLFTVANLKGVSPSDLFKGDSLTDDFSGSVYDHDVTLPQSTSSRNEIQEDPPAQEAQSESTEQEPAVIVGEDQVIFHNARPNASLTIDGKQVDFQYSGQDIVLARSQLPDVAQVRIVAPTQSGWETAAVWFNYRYGNELTFGDEADYGSYTPCTQDGKAQPSTKVIDVLTWAYYRGFLQSINEQSLDYMAYSSASNTQEQSRNVFSDLNSQNIYDMGDYSAVCDPNSISYTSNDRVIYNASFRCIYTDRKGGESKETTNHRTIELIWEDGIWKVNDIAFLSNDDFAARRYADLTQ